MADDPETLRIKQNTKHISNVAYHGDLEKKAAMEKQRGSAEVSDSSSEYSSFSSSFSYHPPLLLKLSPTCVSIPSLGLVIASCWVGFK